MSKKAATIIMIMQNQCRHTDIYIFTMAMFSSRFIKHQVPWVCTTSKIGLLCLSIEHSLSVKVYIRQHLQEKVLAYMAVGRIGKLLERTRKSGRQQYFETKQPEKYSLPLFSLPP